MLNCFRWNCWLWTSKCRLSAQFVGNKAKGRISRRWVFQENKARQISRKTNNSYPLIRTRTCAYQGVRNVCFFGKFGVLCFLETPVLRFAPLLSYRSFLTFLIAKTFRRSLEVNGCKYMSLWYHTFTVISRIHLREIEFLTRFTHTLYFPVFNYNNCII